MKNAWRAPKNGALNISLCDMGISRGTCEIVQNSSTAPISGFALGYLEKSPRTSKRRNYVPPRPPYVPKTPI
eukprot:jgi/Botrbrau1/5269/Bobra.0172s0128.1